MPTAGAVRARSRSPPAAPRRRIPPPQTRVLLKLTDHEGLEGVQPQARVAARAATVTRADIDLRQQDRPRRRRRGTGVAGNRAAPHVRHRADGFDARSRRSRPNSFRSRWAPISRPFTLPRAPVFFGSAITGGHRTSADALVTLLPTGGDTDRTAAGRSRVACSRSSGVGPARPSRTFGCSRRAHRDARAIRHRGRSKSHIDRGVTDGTSVGCRSLTAGHIGKVAGLTGVRIGDPLKLEPRSGRAPVHVARSRP